MNRTEPGGFRDELDLTIYINDELYDTDSAVNEPEFVKYTHFRSGQTFVSLNDDGAGEVTFRAEDIGSLIEALEEIKSHHNRWKGVELPVG